MTTTQARTGAPCWIDLMSADADGARRFYADVFGWHAGAASPEFGGYFMFFTDASEATPVAGCMPNPAGSGACDNWGTYFSVADALATLEAAVAAGARVIQPVFDVADLGASANLVDPTGAPFGLWQANTFAGLTRLGPEAPTGSPCYFELHTRDFDAAVAFYRDVIGWDAVPRAEVPGLSYATLGAGEAAAGIMGAADFMGADDQPVWQVYFASTDVDATVAAALAAGGKVVRDAVDTPFGRTADLLDPAGAAFKVMGPNNAG